MLNARDEARGKLRGELFKQLKLIGKTSCISPVSVKRASTSIEVKLPGPGYKGLHALSRAAGSLFPQLAQGIKGSRAKARLCARHNSRALTRAPDVLGGTETGESDGERLNRMLTE